MNTTTPAPIRDEIVATLTDAEVRAWAKRRLRQLAETHGFRIAAMTLETHRSCSRGDYPEDDFDYLYLHACGKCVNNTLTRTDGLDDLARRLKAALIGDPAAEALLKRHEAERLLRQAEELTALAASTAA